MVSPVMNISIGYAAITLGISETNVRNAIRRGELNSVRIGQHQYIPSTALIRYIDSQAAIPHEKRSIIGRRVVTRCREGLPVGATF